MPNFSLEKPQNLIIAILLVAVVVLGYMQFGHGLATPGGLSQKEAVEAAMAFINQNMIDASSPAAELSGEATEEAGLYKFNIKVQGQEFPVYVSKDGNLLFPQGPINIKEVQAQKTATTTDNGQNGTSAQATTIGNFNVTTEDVCMEDGKPVVYFFGSEGCPHCKWQHPVVLEVMKRFEGVVAFHDNMDNGADMDIFNKYSQGGIPTLVLGCKYYREGSGERDGEEQDAKNITALLCAITNNQPGGVCSEVADLVGQIKQ
ncbi:MAG: thioredoxin family protein [Candidatus Pacebacteria bacterium]|nr:thioredoxin family protein [Candidatus Paceibacterota bacterium]